jgi:hypothetical protein
MTASKLVGHMDANGWTLEETARQFDLPIDAVAEARRYTAADRELIAAEAVAEKRSARRIANVHPPDEPNAPTRR